MNAKRRQELAAAREHVKVCKALLKSNKFQEHYIAVIREEKDGRLWRKVETHKYESKAVGQASREDTLCFRVYEYLGRVMLTGCHVPRG